MKKMNRNMIDNYLQLRARIVEQRKVMKALKAEEKLIITDIQDYLNQTDDIGIKLDDTKVLTLIVDEKKINRTKKEYQNKIHDLLMEKGIRDDEFEKRILAAKIENTVQQQKLKIIKSR